MGKYLLIALSLIVHFTAKAQDPHKNDSLVRVLNTSKEDTNKANVLIALCKNNLDYDNKVVGWDPLESTCRHASLSIL